MKCDLFICLTPLQVVIAKSIVTSETYEGVKPEFIYFSLSNSIRDQHYFNDFSRLCQQVEFVTRLPNYPLYLYWLWKRFRYKKYKNIYLASIDSVYIQYILSWCPFENIRTFDDGSANINKSEIYHVDAPNFVEKIKRLLRRITGNKYHRRKIAVESEIHYTIYPGFQNISDKIKPVDLFKTTACSNNPSNDKVTVLLGTVYLEMLQDPSRKSTLIEKINIFISSLDCENILYIPHPRDGFNYFPSIQNFNSALIAEEVIVDLMNSYQSVVLVGLGSSTQFNLIAQERIQSIVLLSSLTKEPFREQAAMLATLGAKTHSLDLL